MTAINLKTTRPATWLGRPGQRAVSNNGTGTRYLVHRWSDTGETFATKTKGDAWRDPDRFITFWRTDLGVTTSMDEAVALAYAEIERQESQ
jgi:hypothetical protein